MKRSYVKLWFSIILIIGLLVINTNADGDTKKYPPNSTQVIESLSFKDTDLKDIARAIAYQYRTNVTIDNSISKKVSISLNLLSVHDALLILATDNECVFKYDSVRYVIAAQKVKKLVEKPKEESQPRLNYYADNNTIDMILNKVELETFVDRLREVTDKNYLITNGTHGKVTGALYRIDLEDGLKNILLNSGFYPQLKDNITYITRSDHYSSLDEPGAKNKACYWVSAQDSKVSIDVTDASLTRVIDDLSNQLNMQVVKLALPESKVTVRCDNMSLERAMYYLFKGTPFTFKHDEDAFIIGRAEDNMLNTVEMIKLGHLRADKVAENLPGSFTENISMNVSIEHNALVLSGTMENVEKMKGYLKAIDKPVPQVTIEALVVDYNLDNMFQFGVEAGTGDSLAAQRPDKWYPGLDVTASGKKINKILNGIGEMNMLGTALNVGNLGKLPDDFYMNIKMLEQDGVANVKSRPLLSTLNGHTASLKIGTVQNYVFNEILPVTNQMSSTFIERETLQKLEANISFEITPWVGPNGQLTLEIKPDFQTPVGQFSPDKRLIPAINTRTLESTVKLKDGETIVLGGLIQETESTTENRIPLLSDIPLIGSLFTNTTEQKKKGELIIYITPRIFYEDEFGYAYYDYGDE